MSGVLVLVLVLGFGLGVVGGGETFLRDLSVLMSIGSARRAAREWVDGSGVCGVSGVGWTRYSSTMRCCVEADG